MLAASKGGGMGAGGGSQQDQSTSRSEPLGLISSSSTTVCQFVLKSWGFASMHPFAKSFPAL